MRSLLLAAVLPLATGCLTHMLPEERGEGTLLHWAPDVPAAQARALAEHKPLLLVMVAGELCGPCCIGGDALRGGALSDPQVVALINDAFVPVWVNARTSPLPNFPPVDATLVEARIDASRHISNLFNLGFFVRSVVMSPDGKTLLNPETNDPHDVQGSLTTYLTEDHFAYTEHRPKPYLAMLSRALERWGKAFPQRALGSQAAR